MHLVMHLVYGSVFRIEFSYTDRVRYNSARIVSFSKFSIFRKFVFVFVFGLSAFVFVFVFKCKSRKRLRSFPTVFIPSPYYLGSYKSKQKKLSITGSLGEVDEKNGWMEK